MSAPLLRDGARCDGSGQHGQCAQPAAPLPFVEIRGAGRLRRYCLDCALARAPKREVGDAKPAGRTS